MAAGYAEPDFKVVDYQIYCLDPYVIDRQTNTGLLLRGPKPKNLTKGDYFVSIGGAQTFGRFCEKPFSALLEERLGLEALNLGRGGAGPSFFSEQNDRLLEYLNNAKFALIQIMAGRSESNSLFDSKGLGYYRRLSDGLSIGCDEAFKQLLEKGDKDFVEQIISETRLNWINNYRKLLQQINVPKILFWFSERKPYYREKYKSVYSLFGKFPQLVNQDMVNQIKKYSDEYVECISSKGLPQLLKNRFTGKITTVEDKWSGSWERNWYYPSPEMHLQAAQAIQNSYNKLFTYDKRHLQRRFWGLSNRGFVSRKH